MRRLTTFWNQWKAFGQFIGDIIGRLILTVFYFSIFAPFGLVMRLFGDPLTIKARYEPQWLGRTTRDVTLDDAGRSF